MTTPVLSEAAHVCPESFDMYLELGHVVNANHRKLHNRTIEKVVLLYHQFYV